MKTEATLFTRDQAWTRMGIISDMPEAEYHQAPAMSYGGLKLMNTTPLDYFLDRSEPWEDSEGSPALRLGKFAHLLILEPERFANEIVLVDVDRRTKAGREILDDLKSRGKRAISPDELESAEGMARSVASHEKAGPLLQGGEAEPSIFWRDPQTGVLCKCRPDYLRLKDGVVVDLKTVGPRMGQSKADLSEKALMSAIHNFKYHWQSGWYLDGVNTLLPTPTTMFAHIFVGTTKPYHVQVGVLNDASLEKARFDYRPILEHYAECLRADHWPAYPPEILALAVPDWSW